jgi:hypothetical protein
MKVTKTKEIVLIPFLVSIIFSLLISNSINNQQVIAQDDIVGGPPVIPSSGQSIGNASLEYESPFLELERITLADGR